ncbi:MmcQ/YjbR family DNA-binding protein [Aeromicrobium wangtongii]|uniref:MmcQ/YjbR family DNA-binding protein n=1 Tax=Aeromicrobium wangtongii TaxID=2969247 RepID=UPI0020174294|nr:MmcQ/YjbR family DNA-binding protein [Aeromicrobium wangtongii]MCL3817403.1 MmcQ/YjbR family DNA-binding protein [Aeromicrobium wangtongii]
MTDVPPDVLARVRAICMSLPEAYEEQAWIGVRWRVRKRTIAHLLTVDENKTTVLKRAFDLDGPITALTFRVPDEDLLALEEAGYPFVQAGWGRNVMALHVTGHTDFTEVAELLTESYCTLAPAKLIARVERPADAG